MSEVSRVIDQLQRAYQGPAWHGPDLSQVLAGVSAETAAARPLPQAHTIWEIVAHVTVWVAVVTRRLKGEQIPTLPPERDWPEVSASDGVAWRDTLDQLAGAQWDLVEEAGKSLIAVYQIKSSAIFLIPSTPCCTALYSITFITPDRWPS